MQTGPVVNLIHVNVDGETVEVAAGATVVAALALRGIGGTRRSVTGEPRTAMCGMGICQECRVTIDGRPHVLACQTLCVDGQTIRTMAPLEPQ
ncbi:2Fe-2S iron-sulfur cluster-binding protein [Paraburkholderia phosphatilytica]|uniref:2Fe-2S iron-sulfur cluster-binding protein n=1 Tax=Paraburkholderia phosphatilytica TaxID=2282883 RepID=UPI000E52942D|nr:2Fe-2S iron-sulfur cluster-binding protein [Paraburkholderia phosphatilytica]